MLNMNERCLYFTILSHILPLCRETANTGTLPFLFLTLITGTLECYNLEPITFFTEEKTGKY